LYPEVEALYKLGKAHWGPRPAYALITPRVPATQGVMNLVYVAQGGVEMPEQLTWFQCLALGNETVRSFPVHEWATLYRPAEFYRKVIVPNEKLFEIRSLAHWRLNCYGID
jgi:hypothetical protein